MEIKDDKKVKSLSDMKTPDMPDKEEEEMDESYSDAFGKWVRDRLKTGKKKMGEVE